MKKKPQKIGLIISGGGMLVSYNAGVVSSLRKILQPDLIIAGSGQLTDSLEKRVWKDFLAEKRMINPWRIWKVFDTDLLISIIKKKAKLKQELVKNSQTKLEISALSLEDGNIHYFDNNDDVLRSIQASHAVPLMAKRIKMKDHYFVDSFISSHVYNHIERAFEEYDMDKVIVINCISFQERVLGYEYDIYKVFESKKFKENFKKGLQDLKENYSLFRDRKHRGKDVFFLEVSTKTDCTPITVDGEILWKAFERGKHDFHKHKKRLCEFLGIYNHSK